MYTIYISHRGDSKILNVIKDSRLKFIHNIVYSPEQSDLESMKNLIMESQFLVADISEQSIEVGIAIGIALEQNIKVILTMNNKNDNEEKLNSIKEMIISYKDGNELIDKLEKSIDFID